MITQRGFTLVELMITLLLVTILSMLALPSFTLMIKNNRLTTQANELILALNLSRSEAVKRGLRVTLCASADQTSCNGGTSWENGYIAFTDADGDTVVDAGDTLLRVGDPLQSAMTLTSGNASITYQATGTPTAVPGNFNLCDDRTGETGRTISISLTGRVSVVDFTCT